MAANNHLDYLPGVYTEEIHDSFTPHMSHGLALHTLTRPDLHINEVLPGYDVRLTIRFAEFSGCSADIQSKLFMRVACLGTTDINFVFRADFTYDSEHETLCISSSEYFNQEKLQQFAHNTDKSEVIYASGYVRTLGFKYVTRMLPAIYDFAVTGGLAEPAIGVAVDESVETEWSVL